MDKREVRSYQEYDEKPNLWQRIGVLNIVLGGMILTISVTFFAALAVVTGPQFSPGENPYEFGFGEVLFSIVVAIFAAGYFSWLQTFMKGKPYVGLIIGLVTLGAFEYALFLEFRGTYTNIFASVIAIIVLIFLGLYFYQGKQHQMETYKATAHRVNTL